MSNAKVHAPPDDPEARRLAGLSLCRIPGSTITDDLEAVTCRMCARVLADRARAARLRPTVRGAAPESGLPVLSPETWAARSCSCGTCESCLHLLDARRQAQFPPRHIRDTRLREFRWSSVSEAIESYAILRIDGFDAGKSIQQAIAELARLGAFVDQSSRDPIRKAHLQAVEVSLFERTLEQHFADAEGGWRRVLAILLVRSVGVPERVAEKGKTRVVVRQLEDEEVAEAAGLSVAEVRSLVRRARQALSVELAARELVPPPSGKSRAWGAYEARVREIEENQRGVA